MTTRPTERFRLETVLRVASSREEQLAYQVGALEQACHLEEARLADLRHVQERTLEEGSAAHRQGTLDVAWLLQAHRYADVLVERIRAQTRRLEESLSELQHWRSALVAASQERRVLEKLKERHRRRRLQHLDHVEMLQAAELTTARYVRCQAEGE